MTTKRFWIPGLAVVILLAALSGAALFHASAGKDNSWKSFKAAVSKVFGARRAVEFVPRTEREKFLYALSEAAMERTQHEVAYDPSYVALDYPGGDVPDDTGVCADVVVRSYRALGIDLQKEVHEDMKANFKLYPKKWGAKRTDTNIDHRRVLNLMKFFSRKGEELPITKNPADYTPGDVVSWDLDGAGLTHMGIVVYEKSSDGQRFKIVHNIGAGPQLQDVLFDWKIIGHHRYYGGRTFSDEQ